MRIAKGKNNKNDGRRKRQRTKQLCLTWQRRIPHGETTTKHDGETRPWKSFNPIVDQLIYSGAE